MSDHFPMPLAMAEKVERIVRILQGMLDIDPTMEVDYRTLTCLRDALVHALKMKSQEPVLNEIIRAFSDESHKSQSARDEWVDNCMAREKHQSERKIEMRKLRRRAFMGAGSAVGLALIKMEFEPVIHGMSGWSAWIVKLFLEIAS